VTKSETELRLLLATDGSRGSAVAADYAFALARSWGASLSLMNVLECPPGLDPQNPVNQLYLTELMKQATTELATLKARAVDRGISAHTRIATGIQAKKSFRSQLRKILIWSSWAREGRPAWHMCCWGVRPSGLSGERPARFWPRALNPMGKSRPWETDETLRTLNGSWCRLIFLTTRLMPWSMPRWSRNGRRPLSHFFMCWNLFRTDWTSRSPIGQSENRSRQIIRNDYQILCRRLPPPVLRPNSRCRVDCRPTLSSMRLGSSLPTWL
jgi:hypothetical protein